MMFEVSVAFKYLIPRKKHLSVTLIAMMSVGVISLIVWLLLVFLSVTSGIEAHEEKVVKKVKKQAEVNLVEEVITKREVKYIYPADCQDTLSRKKHRQQVRNQLNRLELEMLRIEDKQSKEFKAKEKEYLKFKKANVKSA